MRFPRNAKPFRGQIDLAPLAGVLFLLVIFVLLASLVYTPGVPIQLSSANPNAGVTRKNLLIKAQGEIVFEKQIYKTNSMEQLRAELKALALPATIVVVADKGAPRNVLIEVREMARGLRLGFEVSGTAIELPPAQNFVGAAGATAVVNVNIAGQFFFENQYHEAMFFKLIRAAFSHKRKFALSNIKNVFKDIDVVKLLQEQNISEKVRAEDMKLTDWITLSKKIL